MNTILDEATATDLRPSWLPHGSPLPRMSTHPSPGQGSCSPQRASGLTASLLCVPRKHSKDCPTEDWPYFYFCILKLQKSLEKPSGISLAWNIILGFVGRARWDSAEGERRRWEAPQNCQACGLNKCKLVSVQIYAEMDNTVFCKPIKWHLHVNTMKMNNHFRFS